MIRLEYVIERYHVEVGADRDRVTNNFVNLHCWIRYDPNTSSAGGKTSRLWDSLDRVVFQCTGDADVLPSGKEDGKSALMNWRLMQRDREGYSMVAALMPLERFPIIIDLFRHAPEVRLIVFPENERVAYTTIETGRMPVGTG